MSRTRKTDPLKVKVNKHPTKLVENHDHRLGLPCDLPKVPVYKMFDSTTRCVWDVSDEMYYDKEVWSCGCPICSQSIEHKQDRRRARKVGRRYTEGDWVEEYYG